MALIAVHKNSEFGVGDTVRVVQKIKEGEKSRLASFEGMVIAIKGRQENQSFTVRKIAAGQIGVERIFPISSPTIEKVDLVKHGLKGVRHSKLYYVRSKSKREIDKIYSRAARKDKLQKPKKHTPNKVDKTL